MAAPPPPPNLKNCPKCGHSNLAENVYCGKCGGAVQPGVTGPATAGTAAFPRSLVVLSAARLAISAVMLAILLFFFIMFMALVGNLGNLGGGGQCPTGEKWDDVQKKCVPDGGGGINVQGIDYSGGPPGMTIESATCSQCQTNTGGIVKISITIRNSDSTDHQVTGFGINSPGFSFSTSNPSTPDTIPSSMSHTYTVEYKAPNSDWSGRIYVTVQGS